MVDAQASIPLTSESQAIIADLQQIHAQLAEHQAKGSLSPSPSVDASVLCLEHLCSQNFSEIVVQECLANVSVQRILPHLRRIRSEREFLVELYWAEKISLNGTNSSSAATPAAIHDFPDYEKYISMIHRESHAILSVTNRSNPPTKFAILGSGPLPLTAISLLKELRPQLPKIHVHNIDCSRTAIQLGSKVIACLEDRTLSEAMTFEHIDAADTVDLKAFDVIYLAALVGLDTETKTNFITHLRRAMRRDALLVLRTAHSLRKILYAPINLHDLIGFTILLVHPFNHPRFIIARRD